MRGDSLTNRWVVILVVSVFICLVRDRAVAQTIVLRDDSTRMPIGPPAREMPSIPVHFQDIAPLPGDRFAVLTRSSGGDRVLVHEPTGALVAGTPNLDQFGLREPIALASNTTGTLYVLDAGGSIVRFVSSEDPRMLPAKLGRMTLAAARGLCALGSHAYVLGVEDIAAPGSLIHIVTEEFEQAGSFGAPFGGSNPLVQVANNSGRLVCDSAEDRVVVASSLYPEVRSYAADGTLLWSTPIPGFRPIGIESRRPAGIAFVLPGDSVWDQVISAFIPAPGVVAVQSRRRRGFVDESLSVIATYYLRSADGALLGSQTGLPRIVAAIVGGWAYALDDADGRHPAHVVRRRFEYHSSQR
jgi:hypothetical protein